MKAKNLTSDEIQNAIKEFRNAVYQVLPSGPNNLPHALLFISSMLHGVAQAQAFMLSEAALSQTLKKDVNVEVLEDELVNDSVTNDLIAMAALLMIRCHSIGEVEGNRGIMSGITPDIIAATMTDFKTLKGREPVGIASALLEVAKHGGGGVELPPLTPEHEMSTATRH
jgi:hypothetical protein